MLETKDISKENWDIILSTNLANDTETIEYLKAHEEEILNILIEDGIKKSLDEKRKQYIRSILSQYLYREDIEDVISKIMEIRANEGYSILQFGKTLSGSSNTVFEFGDKVIKLGKYFKILNDPNILQPEYQMRFDKDSYIMRVFERLPEVFTVDDKDIAQEMYNRVRDSGILWFDALGCNVGRTNKRRDSNDDGLRIIDAQYMEYEKDVLMRIQPEKNERYKNIGIGAYGVALRDYIFEKGYGSHEKKYEEMKEERKKYATKEDIGIVAKQSSIGGLQRIKGFLSNLFYRKRKKDIDER